MVAQLGKLGLCFLLCLYAQQSYSRVSQLLQE
jgi:hypothetical protein